MENILKIPLILLGVLFLVSLAFAQSDLQAEYVSEFGEIYSWDLVARCPIHGQGFSYEYYAARCMEEGGGYMEVWMVCYCEQDGVRTFKNRYQVGREEIQ